MIDVFVSDECPQCHIQAWIMKQSFKDNEYRLLTIGSEEYEQCKEKDLINAVPFIIVRNPDGTARYANKGLHEPEALRKIGEFQKEKATNVFNLSKVRAAKKVIKD